jgi:PAS domain S-box-containing protein
MERKIDQLEKLTERLAQEDYQRQIITTKLEMAINAAEIGVWDYACFNGHELLWNKHMISLWGYDMEDSEPFERKYENFIDRVHPDDQKRVETLVQKSIEKQVPYQTEYRVIRPDGSMVCIDARGQMMEDHFHKPRLVGICIEVKCPHEDCSGECFHDR